ncbi:TonB-dependent receptor [Sphingosinicella microcystinivorans]|uniref:Iron complex outermembrane receptor protein n=1 Tax=Sphingosinicella microcystinivorans TaxID=335406 RepID=A0AAD1D5Q4_SPHMI|nr:TonB-dependent receptor [Sphingosinicella microcystinivorans]RKS91426.1 iron complex outermembrane receptor protein [Sphingosinicella microcystinivorans]BBE34401.1 TonB-dependent receptor [Sphingosinicella microcystinivorans]
MIHNRTFRQALFAGTLPAIALAAFCNPAFAAETEAVVALPEIIVTARKQQESLQNVPISVTAFDSESIELHNFNNVQDMSYSIPNLNFSRLTTLSTSISIRGINSADNAPGFETGVAVILDDVYIGRAAGFTTNLIDIERVEVLRGPQGTLQGRNVTAGSINIVTDRPSDDFKVKGKISYGNYDELTAMGVVSGPIIPGKLAGKIGIARIRNDGYGRNVSLDKPLDSTDAWSFRGQLAFTPTDDLTILLTGDYDDYDNHDSHGYFGPPDIVKLTPDITDREATGDVWNNGFRKVGGGALNIYYTFPNEMTLASITSARAYDVSAIQEGDPDQNWGPSGAGTFVATARNDQKQNQFSQEVRLASPSGGNFTWLTGLYYYRDTLKNYQNFLFGVNTGSVIAGASTIDDSRSTTKSYAAFGSATNHFSDRFSVTGGLRYTINKRGIRVLEALGIDGTDAVFGDYVDMLTQDDPAPTEFDALVALGTTRNKVTDKALTGDLTFTVDWTDDVSTFAKYAHGFKGGGFNASFNSGFSGGSVKPEYIDSFELGLRSMLFDRKLRFNLTNFYMKVKDQQTLIYDSVAFRYVTANEPGVRTYGFELDAAAVLMPELTWSLGVGYINSEITGGANKGLRPAYSSPWSINTSLSFDQPVTETLNLFAFGEASWRDSYALLAGSPDASRQGAYWWLGGKVGVKAADGSWSLSLYGRNLTNETVASYATNVPGLFTVAFLQPPRTYGVELSFNF